MNYNTLHLKPEKHLRIAAGHLWAFAGEIRESLKDLPPGSAVSLCESRGRLLGRGYVNPHSLIAVRLLTRGEEAWDEGLFRRRIANALEYRRIRLGGGDDLSGRAYRLIYSESDGLPGLVVDHYAGHLVLQSLTAGIEARLGEVVAALEAVIEPQSIFLKGQSPYRRLEGLPEADRQLTGTTHAEIQFSEGRLTLSAHPLDGQKTGFYLDQFANRQLLTDRFISPGSRVLDLYSYTGAWGLSAVAAGAGEAVMVDSSGRAISWGMEDARRNGLSDRALFVEADVEIFLKDAASRGSRWDVVILDPPALIPNRSAVAAGRRAYLALNRAAVKVVAPGGMLVTCSCSHLMTREMHLAVIGEAAARESRRIRLAAAGGHSPDHPILPGHPETEYLKCWFVSVET
ncbi:MAG: class I SAM-dependent rRNA methyltransferase [Calditrichaeota bacterium]|nr:class I SAM-dependent rRNA methyltransferase [Calditrichota bacterium]